MGGGYKTPEAWNLCYTCGGSGIVEDTTYLYEVEALYVESYDEQVACTTVCPDCLGLRVVTNCEDTDHGLSLRDQFSSARQTGRNIGHT